MSRCPLSTASSAGVLGICVDFVDIGALLKQVLYDRSVPKFTGAHQGG